MDGILYFPHKLARVLLSQGAGFSLTSLGAALLIAAAVIAWRRLRRNRPLRAGTLWRALFPAWLVRHASLHADIAYFGFNVFVYGLIFGWAVVSYKFLSGVVADGLAAGFGALAPTTHEVAARAAITLALFLAYEFGYWADHYLKHKVPALWELHKVHHSANVLTPLTVFRIHPLDSVIFANIVAVSLGVTNGVANYLFGKSVTAVLHRRREHHPGAVRAHLRASPAHAFVDRLHRPCGPRVSLARASPDPSLEQSGALRQESRKLSRDL